MRWKRKRLRKLVDERRKRKRLRKSADERRKRIIVSKRLEKFPDNSSLRKTV